MRSWHPIVTASTPGATFLARQRHDLQQQPANPATASLAEVAALHDGQPPADWLRLFWRLWDAEAA